MYKVAFILALLTINLSAAFGQTKSDPCSSKIDTLTEQEVYIMADKMPMPEGGYQALRREISKKIKLQSEVSRRKVK